MERISGVLIPGLLALLFIAIGLPLVFRKIKPNYFYGYRLSSFVIEDDDIWYRVNETGGKHLVIIGCFVALISILAIFYIGQTEIQSVFLAAGLSTSVIGIILSLARTLFIANKMAKDKGIK
ncbi:MAG TPA: SdpI family protein [Bacteroidales bacterium]|jgi:membrane-associated PAP2 superfamily phosphatase|nr:MAG: hypothetical protein BWX96_02895 [Bacteroidetes bacterium ADurb.Bin145]HOU03532.1 SdpI family protein [Bacteroidales bacterium]HQK68968.1 SdpI family protein [Bacteroidales bacterium]